ncbi:MAG: CDP-diacylglycerol--glycerol-3-phosphate 3-phosphatidyltransferase [Bdellovibrionota bacterium]|nr:MAG: CDP-diacylglycerol--glycerol-3-phosphate 3-phosphatidyltransferase [Bdellovibrionota bacterium]
MSLRARIPNLLTYLRLALIPVFVLLMIDPTPGMVRLALFVFIIAAITDSLDGFVARRWGAVSNYGKLLDPLADKILVMAALVMLVAQRSDLYGEPWVPGWMVVLVLAREIWVTGVRGVAASKGLVLQADGAGKLKSVLQMAAICFLLLHHTQFRVGAGEMSAQLIGANLLLVSIMVSYWGAIGYTTSVMRLMSVDENSSPGKSGS